MASIPPIPNPLPSIEQQLRGVHDDGSSEGIFRVKIDQGDLVKVPLTRNAFNTSVQGTSSIGAVGLNATNNSDGSMSVVSLVVPPGAPNGASLQTILQGRAIGIRFLRYSANNPLYVAIDGISYSLLDTEWTYNSKGYSLFDGSSAWIVADDLKDGPHRVSVIVPSDPNGVNTNRLSLYGFLAERRAGYSDPKPLLTPQLGSVTTSAVLIPAALGNGSLRSIRKVTYYNSTASAIAVTVKLGSTTVWQQSVPANASLDCDFGDDVTIDSTTSNSWQHLAAATGVTFAAFGKI